jgi:cation transport ATPase
MGELNEEERMLYMATVRELATHAADIKHIQEDMDKLVASVKAMEKTLADINSTLATAKGGWKAMMLVAGASGALGTVLVKMAHWWGG